MPKRVQVFFVVLNSLVLAALLGLAQEILQMIRGGGPGFPWQMAVVVFLLVAGVGAAVVYGSELTAAPKPEGRAEDRK